MRIFAFLALILGTATFAYAQLLIGLMTHLDAKVLGIDLTPDDDNLHPVLEAIRSGQLHTLLPYARQAPAHFLDGVHTLGGTPTLLFGGLLAIWMYLLREVRCLNRLAVATASLLIGALLYGLGFAWLQLADEGIADVGPTIARMLCPLLLAALVAISLAFSVIVRPPRAQRTGLATTVSPNRQLPNTTGSTLRGPA